jgi:hypothetical protein
VEGVLVTKPAKGVEMATEEKDLPGPTRTFVQYLYEIDEGRLVGELTQEMRDLVTEVRDQQKPGTLTLTLKVEPTKAVNTLIITDQISVKPPKHTPGASIFYPDEEGYLHRKDPMQPELPLQEVPRRDAKNKETSA